MVLYGSPLPQTVPFPCQNLGVVPPRDLAALYHRASVGVVFSLTNLSLVTQEMMASGLPVVELDRNNIRSVLGSPGDLAMLAEPTPDGVADAVEAILGDLGQAAEMARRAGAFVERRTWSGASDQLERVLLNFLSRPRVDVGRQRIALRA